MSRDPHFLQYIRCRLTGAERLREPLAGTCVSAQRRGRVDRHVTFQEVIGECLKGYCRRFTDAELIPSHPALGLIEFKLGALLVTKHRGLLDRLVPLQSERVVPMMRVPKPSFAPGVVSPPANLW